MMNMIFKREMPTANVIQEMYPLSEAMRERKKENDERMKSVAASEERIKKAGEEAKKQNKKTDTGFRVYSCK